MDIAVTGSTGLVGRALVAHLEATGHSVRPVVRAAPAPGLITWDPDNGRIDAGAMAGIDAVIHLAGQPIAARRWTDAQKRRILESRTRGTALIAQTVARLDPKPAVFLSASAIGFYGDRGEAALDEASPRGQGFLADVTVAWESATAPAAEAGIRTAQLRTGIVLSPSGGAMARTLPLFRVGLGGRFGSGRQWWSWITLDDEVAAIVHLLDADVAGPVNLTAPNPVTNATFTKVLASVLHRPAILPIPKLGPALLYGRELATELLWFSARVEPQVLSASGFTFAHPDLDGAFRSILL